MREEQKEKKKDETEKDRCPGDTLPTLSFSRVYLPWASCVQSTSLYASYILFPHLMYYFMHMNSLPAYMQVYHKHASDPLELELWMNGCEPPCRCLEVNPGLLQEQPCSYLVSHLSGFLYFK